MSERKLYGVGINDSDYPVTASDGSRCKYYTTWKAMLARAYSKLVHEAHPSYIGVEVCEQWKLFSNFKAWMEQQDWQGKQLDKDILEPGNKLYAPEKCCFVSKEVNTFVTERGALRGSYPIGVSFECGLYRARVRDNGRSKHLGLYATPEAAHLAWALAKRVKLTELLAKVQTPALVEAALVARYDHIVNIALKACDGTQH